MLKIGQIGIGHNHSNKINVLKKYPDHFQLVGYAEENEEWLRRRGNNKTFCDVPRLSVEEVLAKSDAILVETDVWDLTKTAQMCIDAGKHIHMDKPASGTLAEYKHLLDTAKEKNLVVQLGYMYRYNPGVQRLFQMVSNGELGQITSIHAEMSIRHTDSYRQWLGNFHGGDMYIFGCHLIDLIVYLLGKPNRVTSSLASSGIANVHSTDLTAATLEYDHALARVFSSSLEWNGWANRCFRVCGELGTADIQPMEEPCIMTFAPKHESKKAGVQMGQPVDLNIDPQKDRYDDMLLAFHDYIVGKTVNPFSYDHEYALQEVLDQAVDGIKMLGKELEIK